MKLKFKHQAYQAHAVAAVADCFAGQSQISGIKYRVDPGLAKKGGQQSLIDESGFRNNDVVLTSAQLLENIHRVQHRQNLPHSPGLVSDKKTGCPINLDIEMETGTGKTYCYIKTVFELNKRYGWSKFIVVVPSIAIREGVYKSLEITAEHFLEDYGKRIRFFIYNSKQLHNLESFSSDAGIDEKYFTGKVLKTAKGDVEVTADLARDIEFYLIQNGYVDKNRHITTKYHESKQEGLLVELPTELAVHAEQVFQLIDSVFSEAQMPEIENGRNTKTNPLNANFEKKEFKELWNRINHKAAYAVDFATPELVKKCVTELDKELRVSPLQYTIQRGEQMDEATYDAVNQGESFQIRETLTESNKTSIHSNVKYDLIGKLAEETKLTRRTIPSILQEINNAVFDQFKTNPEDFIAKATLLINEQKATVIVEHLAYDTIADTHSLDIFTQDKRVVDLSKTGDKLKRHIYDYVFTDSANERSFVNELDTSKEVVVYAKLPKGFFIPTPVGDYNPDWAISFKEGTVKHIYFIAETKGSMSSMDLRKIEECKIKCAKKFFAKITSEQVKYDVVDSFGKLMELVK